MVGKRYSNQRAVGRRVGSTAKDSRRAPLPLTKRAGTVDFHRRNILNSSVAGPTWQIAGRQLPLATNDLCRARA